MNENINTKQMESGSSSSLKNKCYSCQTKLKLINFKCVKCNFTFCIKCRLPEQHKCNYDYKQDKVKLEKIVKDKVTKI